MDLWFTVRVAWSRQRVLYGRDTQKSSHHKSVSKGGFQYLFWIVVRRVSTSYGSLIDVLVACLSYMNALSLRCKD